MDSHQNARKTTSQLLHCSLSSFSSKIEEPTRGVSARGFYVISFRCSDFDLLFVNRVPLQFSRVSVQRLAVPTHNMSLPCFSGKNAEDVCPFCLWSLTASTSKLQPRGREHLWADVCGRELSVGPFRTRWVVRPNAQKLVTWSKCLFDERTCFIFLLP